MMKPFKIIRKAEIFDKGRWQYKSNSDPFSKSEEPKWEFYSLKHNYLIEKAYYYQQKEVDIGAYVISLKHMIQKKKGAMIRQRPIRRVNWEDTIEEMDRSARYFETELPKTMNKVFGSLRDFVRFFSRRNLEILDFSSQFEEIEKSNDLEGLNHNIIPKLACCLEELVKPVLEETQDPSWSELKKKFILNKKKRHQELISLFKTEFPTFEEFYGEVLRAYTMSTDLYDNLNRFLRNESWIEIDNLLPYAFCLCKAFFTLKSQNNEVMEIENLSAKSIILYRGTAFDERSLSFYKTSERANQYFSWNCVTSTSTKREAAEKFMYTSVDLPNQKYPVLFIIEIPISEDQNKSENLEWIDIRQYSAIPKEDEVILAPGSVFELVEAPTDKDEIKIIRLKLKNKVQSLAHTGLIMPGAMQSKMLINRQVKIVCLEGEELFDVLKCLTGNKLVEEMEFCLCIFDKKSLGTMIETLSTLERAKEVKFVSCDYKDNEKLPEGIRKEFKKWNISRVEIVEMNDFYKVFTMQNEDNREIMAFREFQIDFIGQRREEDIGINSIFLQGLGNLGQLTSLDLNLSKFRQITDEEIHGFASQELRYLTQLTSLALDFSVCENITNKGVSSLASQGLQQMKKLTSLSLNFSECLRITDKGMRSLASEGLRHLNALISLNFIFESKYRTNKLGINSLASQGFQNLTCLKSLVLNFSERQKITDEEVCRFTSQSFQYLTQLTSFTLNFGFCKKFTDEGVSNLAGQGLRFLTQLTSLHLDFCWCNKITDKGISSLASEGLQHLTQLASLTLKFDECKKITNEGIWSLATQGIRYHTQLTSLNLDFSYCKKISDKGASGLISEGLQHLTQLTSLELDFAFCSELTSQGRRNLVSQVLGHLNQLVLINEHQRKLKFESDLNPKNPLTHQTGKFIFRRALDKHEQLVFDKEFQTDKTAIAQVTPSIFESSQQSETSLRSAYQQTRCFSYPASPNSKINVTCGYNHFSQLTTVSLDFSQCEGLIGEGVNNLRPLQSLTELVSLSFCFSRCDITDKGLENLTHQWLRNLMKLTSLTLDWKDCRRITDDGIHVLASEGLQNLTQLVSLSLKLPDSSKITDKTMSSLAYSLQCLLDLTSLTLEFSYSSFWGSIKLSNQGFHILASQGFRFLKKLTSLNFCASSSTITDEDVQSFASQGLQYLTQLTSLTLEFPSCYNIPDRGFHILASQGLRNLTKLSSLTLDFSSSPTITDTGVNNLISHALKHLTQLISLTLDFSHCPQITAFTFSNLTRILYYFGFVSQGENES